MAKIQEVVFGEEWLNVSANKNGYKLTVQSDYGTAIFYAPSRQEMADIVSEIGGIISAIDYELSISYASVFKGLCEKTEEEGKEDEQI